jgi:hypothetical protein
VLGERELKLQRYILSVLTAGVGSNSVCLKVAELKISAANRAKHFL